MKRQFVSSKTPPVVGHRSRACRILVRVCLFGGFSGSRPKQDSRLIGLRSTEIGHMALAGRQQEGMELVRGPHRAISPPRQGKQMCLSGNYEPVSQLAGVAFNRSKSGSLFDPLPHSELHGHRDAKAEINCRF